MFDRIRRAVRGGLERLTKRGKPDEPLDTAVCGGLTLFCLALDTQGGNRLPGAGMIVAGGHEIIITRPGTYILRGKSRTTGVRVDHSAGAVTLILDRVDIDLSGIGGAAALRMTCTGSGNPETILVLKGVSRLRSGEGCAAVHSGMTALTVMCYSRWSPDKEQPCGGKWPHECRGYCVEEDLCGTCTATCGRLIASGGAYGAGIGGGAYTQKTGEADRKNEESAPTDAPQDVLDVLIPSALHGREGGCITIGSGVIKARGGEGGAGIGGGTGDGRVIAVYGGDICASGGEGAAGIGGGAGGRGRHIMIRGGRVRASGGRHGAGIGGGALGSGMDIALLGGGMEARGGEGAAGIGGGAYGGADDILIRDGCVSASGGRRGAGVGSGSHGDCAIPPHRLNRGVTIEGGEVAAKGGEGAAGVGGGFGGNASYIAVHGGKLTARGGCNACAIGSGEGGSVFDMQFTRGKVTAIGGEGENGRMQGIEGLGTRRDVTHTTCRITMTGTIHGESGFNGGYVRPYTQES